MTAKTIEARDAIAYELENMPALQRLGHAEIYKQAVPKVKREELEQPRLYVTFASAVIERQTRGYTVTNPTIDIGLVAPLNDSEQERENQAEFYLDQLEQIGRAFLASAIEGWHVATCEVLTLADPERWRNMGMYAGILRLTVEQR